MSIQSATILVTGGAGFIGSNFIHYVFKNKELNFSGKIINVDKLTYAGNLENVKEIQEQYPTRYFFENCDICDYPNLQKIFAVHNIDIIVHFAAESHVDKSILGPKKFIDTNIQGTFYLLEIAREIHEKNNNIHFHHVSTDEVFGSIENGRFNETTPYNPRNPYSASKAAADHIVRSYFHTYNLPVTLSNCSNNFGPRQFPEKLIPLVITRLHNQQNVPVYGTGKNIRDWLYVDDHNSAIVTILEHGKIGETYNIGGENEWENIRLVELLCQIMAKLQGKNENYYKQYITFVTDRKGHDLRYAIDCSKIKQNLGWKQQYNFEKALEYTVKWYLNMNVNLYKTS